MVSALLARLRHSYLGRSTQAKSGVVFHPGWRRALLITVPFTVLAFVLGIVFELAGHTDLFDLIAYSLSVAALLGFELLLLFCPQQVVPLAAMMISGVSIFLLSKLVFVLFLAPPGTNVLGELTESFFWAPIGYIAAFLIPGVRWGRFGIVLFGVLMPVVSAVYLIFQPTGPVQLEVVYALVQFNLANFVMILLIRLFALFHSRFAQVQNHSVVMEQLAHTDTLTGLPNRLTLEAALKTALDKKRPFALIFIDLDRFKRINDTQGHASGDELLAKVAERLKAISRPGDTLARVSGDEFVLLAYEVGDDRAAWETAQKLQKSFSQPFVVAQQHLRVTASLGFCLYPQDAGDANTLLRHADSAMYRAKAAGRDGLSRFSLKDTDTERLRTLEKELEGAETRGELNLVFQPLYSLESGQLVKVEALLRWQHPEWGVVSPEVFIPLAEESGVIVPIGRWVLHSALQTLAAWRRAGFAKIVMSVNISPVQLTQVGFFAEVTQALRTNGLSGGDLELEITERTVLHNTEEVISILTRLQALGVRIAMDDFGTGYSSLGYLRDLPLDTIKIDRSFVKDLAQPLLAPHYAVALVRAIASVAETLDLEIVAEGVETEETAKTLKQLGCHLAQGSFFARPLPEDEVRVLLPLNQSKVSNAGHKRALAN